jgi:hypothetical protein
MRKTCLLCVSLVFFGNAATADTIDPFGYYGDITSCATYAQRDCEDCAFAACFGWGGVWSASASCFPLIGTLRAKATCTFACVCDVVGN